MPDVRVFYKFVNEGTWRDAARADYETFRDNLAGNMSSAGSNVVEVVEVAVLRRVVISPKRVEYVADLEETVDDVTRVAVENAPAFVLELQEQADADADRSAHIFPIVDLSHPGDPGVID